MPKHFQQVCEGSEFLFVTSLSLFAVWMFDQDSGGTNILKAAPISVCNLNECKHLFLHQCPGAYVDAQLKPHAYILSHAQLSLSIDFPRPALDESVLSTHLYLRI